jgi:hypothetical protein
MCIVSVFKFDFELNVKYLTPSPSLVPRSGIFQENGNAYTSLSGGKLEAGFNKYSSSSGIHGSSLTCLKLLTSTYYKMNRYSMSGQVRSSQKN